MRNKIEMHAYKKCLWNFLIFLVVVRNVNVVFNEISPNKNFHHKFSRIIYGEIFWGM